LELEEVTSRFYYINGNNLIEGDILKALVAKNLAKVEALHQKLAKAKLALYQAESRQLG